MIFLNRQTLTLIFVLMAILFAYPLQAAHIIGGVITYDCLSTGEYRITMKIYRDCAGGGARFDSDPQAPFIGTVTIYEGNSNTPFQIVSLPPPAITKIEPNLSNPCLDAPDDICVEEGVYVFDVNLPVSNNSYHIVYQRCCRNSTISNIVAPEATGATYYMELTPLAQSLCNDSPEFNDFPPIVICAGEPIDFDHAATDPDGDVLVYELCESYVGGGNNTSNPELPTGVAPNPDLPPPFNSVNYSGFYDFDNPLLGNPPLAIDPNTGFMTGVPAVTGQFVVGVCVKEYRNGELLSMVFRDFQFNIELCEFNVFADIVEDDTVLLQGQQFYVVKACGTEAVTFENESTQVENIDGVLWNFDVNGTATTSTAWSPTISFPGPGTYFGTLELNPGVAAECADTAYIQVDVFPGVESDFSFDYDTCVAGPVAFTDLSASGAGPSALVDWEWDFGDGLFSNQQNPSHLYQVPGDLPVTLTVTDVNDCQARQTRIVRYFPVPELLLVAPSDFIGCQPATIFFDNLSTPVNENYDLFWDFGDGGSSTAVSPTYTFEDLGTFTVSLDVTSPLGCMVDTTWDNLITILPSPVAGFSYSPDRPSNILPTVTFTDESIDAIAWKWTFGNLGASVTQNPVFTFPDTGMQAVQLVVFHPSGCTDTMIQFLDVIPEVRYFLPNAFTPNGDGNNDGFRGNGIMEGASDFNLSIWNRYGEKVFETEDWREAWNGRKNNTGQLAPQGVYVVVVTYREPRGALRELRGFATLVK